MKRPRTRAFTLLEVLIAGAIFLIIFVASSQVFFSTRLAYAQQRDFMTAENVAQQQMERLLVLAPVHPDLAPGNHAARTFDRDGIPIRAAGDAVPSAFRLTWSVAADTPVPAMRRISATVEWQGQRGEGHDMTFVTDRD